MLPPDDDAALVEDEADIVPPGEIGVGFLRVVVRDVKAAAGKLPWMVSVVLLLRASQLLKLLALQRSPPST